MSKINFTNRKFLVFLLVFTLFFSNLALLFCGFKSNDLNDVLAQSSTGSTTVSLSNSQFENPNSGTFPRSPSNWTTSGSKGHITSGIIDVSQRVFEENMDTNYELSFNPGTYASMNDNYVLMINSKSQLGNYGYVSSGISLTKDSFYTISFKVYTQNVHEVVSFASAYLTNIDDAKIEYIRTNGNYIDCTFFVATDSINDQSTNLELWLGTKNNHQSNGAVFFDKVEILKHTEEKFYTLLNQNIKNNNGSLPSNMASVNLSQQDISNLIKNNNFENALSSSNWQIINSDNQGAGSQTISGVFKIDNSFSSVATGVENSPTNANLYNNTSALLINNIQSRSVGYRSNEFTLNQLSFYKLSVMVKTSELEGNAELKLVEKNPFGEGSNYYSPITVTHGSITTHGKTNEALNNWIVYNFFIKTSAFYKTTLSLELWLGNETTSAKGYAFFDNIKLVEISSNDYSIGSSQTNSKVANFSGYSEETSVANGAFNEVTKNATSSFPYEPTNWKINTSDNLNYNSGVINTNSTTFNAIGLSNVSNPLATDGSTSATYSNNVLMLGNISLGNQNYTTNNSISLSADSYYKFSFLVQTQNLNNALASFRLINNYSTIFEKLNISTTGAGDWQKYEILVKTGMDSENVKIELGLGQNYNGTGYAFFDDIKMSTATEADFKNASGNQIFKIDLTKEEFKSVGQINNDNLYNSLSWTGNLISSTNSTLTESGVVDTKNYSNTISGISNPGESDGSSGNMLAIINRTDAIYNFTSLKSYNITSGSYYKLSVKLKTLNLRQDETNKVLKDNTNTNDYYDFGASISLNGVDAYINGINTNNEFETYTIYINATTSTTFTISLGLGYVDNNNQILTQGYAFFEYVDFASIEQNEFKTIAKQEQDKIDNNEEASHNILLVGNTDITDETPTQTPATTSNFDWLLIPTLITSLALIIAVVGFGLRKIKINKPVKIGQSDYDRAKSLIKDAERREQIRKREQRLKQLQEELENVKSLIEKNEENYKKALRELKNTVASKLSKEDQVNLSKQEIRKYKQEEKQKLKLQRKEEYNAKKLELQAKYDMIQAEIEQIYQEELAMINEYKEYKRQVKAKKKEQKMNKLK